MRAQPQRYVISGKLEVKLYHDTRPNRMEIADLQKGLVLEVESKEIIGEGIGFGTPVAIYRDEVVFSKSARLVNVGPVNITKIFQMDSISRVEFRGIIFGGPFYKKFYDIFSDCSCTSQVSRVSSSSMDRPNLQTRVYAEVGKR